MSPRRVLLHYVRYTHLYFGVFIAPALLFFAFTGALQIFSFHEITPGSSYKPPAWIVTLAQIHKKQTMALPVKKPQAPALQSPASRASDSRPERPQTRTPLKAHNPLPLKFFFLLVSIGLFTSTLTGLYMSYRYSRNRSLITAALAAGVILPVALLFL